LRIAQKMSSSRIIIKERTSDFQKIREEKIATLPGLPREVKISRKSHVLHVSSVDIFRMIIQTRKRLESLNEVINRTTLFEDATAEIEEVTTTLKEEIERIKQEISKFNDSRELLVKKDIRSTALLSGSIGSNIPLFVSSSFNKQYDSHYECIVMILNIKLADIAKEFSSILSKRSQASKEYQKRAEVFTTISSPSTTRSPLYALRQRRRGLEQVELACNTNELSNPAERTNDGTTVFIPMPASSSIYQQQQQQQQLLNRHRKTTLSSAVEKIENTISELQNIFSQLGHLVSEQGELLDRVDTHIEQTLGLTTSGQNSLLKYSATLTSERSLIIKAFLIVFAIITLFVWFYH